MPTIEMDLSGVLAVAARIAIVLLLILVAQRLAARAVPRLAALAVRTDPNDADPLSAEEVQQRRETLSQLVTRTIQVLIVALGGLTVLSELGIDIGPVLAGAGVLGIAIAFGAQALVRDVISGAFILIEDQYRKGDVVKIGGVAGLVEGITLRRTVLRDLDGIVHSVPNGVVDVASNYTHGWSRVNLDISVAYSEDLDRVRSVMDRVGAELAADPEWAARILEAPKVLRVDELGDSGIVMKMLSTTRPLAQWDVAGELRRRIKAAFDAEGIEIPFPHRVVIHRSGEPVRWAAEISAAGERTRADR